jgi:translation initiation factor 2 subunit 3
MDAAILVIAANEPCPQPQTIEHTKALEILGVEQLIVVQNKIDVVPPEKLRANYKQIKDFLATTKYTKAPVIPASALHRVNIDVIAMAIAKLFKEPERVLGRPAIMQIARSFDVNLPGTPPEELVGGVVGGALMKGEIKVGDEVEIKPGVRVVTKGRITYEPLITEITSIRYGEIEVDVAKPGGLVALGTKLDPSLTKGDALRGQVLGHSVPDAVQELRAEYRMLEKVVGAREMVQPPKLKAGDSITLIIGTRFVNAVVNVVASDEFEAKLVEPAVVFEKSRLAILMKIGGRLRLVGWGQVTS